MSADFAALVGFALLFVAIAIGVVVLVIKSEDRR
jgi:hypothetical protein